MHFSRRAEQRSLPLMGAAATAGRQDREDSGNAAAPPQWLGYSFEGSSSRCSPQAPAQHSSAQSHPASSQPWGSNAPLAGVVSARVVSACMLGRLDFAGSAVRTIMNHLLARVLLS